jgi:chemotaxis protein methyltransferase CheR
MAAPLTGRGDNGGDVEELEIALLLEGVRRRFGPDFRDYRPEVVRHRVQALMARLALNTVSALQERVLHHEAAAAALLRALSPPPTALFDDPAHFRALRAQLGPLLRSCPAPRLWLAECVCPEQVYAVAILLAEEKLEQRTHIFATAANEELLQEAREGVFPRERLPSYAENHVQSGGRRPLADYIALRGERASFDAGLVANVTWCQYSLASNASFNEFQLIMCRQALSDYGPRLRQRVLRLFDDSIAPLGILGLDRGDELERLPFAGSYRQLAGRSDLYRRVR